MEPVAHPSSVQEREAWNEAYDRLVNFLRAFHLSDHAYVTKTALDLFQDAQKAHRADPSRDPATHTMEQAHQHLTEWLATNLGDQDRRPSHILSSGYIALLLSQVYRTAPTSFLENPLPEELRQALRESLIVTGPDLNVSSMSPRHLDFGPMLQIARQTWHRLDAKELLIAILFWGLIYAVAYWWLSQMI